MNRKIDFLLEKRYPLSVDYSDPENLLTAYRYLLDLIENDIKQIEKDKTFFLNSSSTYEKMLSGEIPVYINSIHAWVLGREFKDGVTNEITEKIAGDSHCFEISQEDKDFDKAVGLLREEIEDSNRKYVAGHIKIKGLKKERTEVLGEVRKLEKVVSIASAKPATVQQQCPQDDLTDVDALLQKYFDWKRLLPVLIEMGAIMPGKGHYVFTENIPRKYLAAALFAVARPEVRRDTNGARRSARQAIKSVFVGPGGERFGRSFWESEFTDPPALNGIKNQTARELVQKLHSVQQ